MITFNRDTEIIKKKIGADFKILIKSSSNDYLEKLKNELAIGFKNYYDELNKKVGEELLAQESQQKDMHDKIDKYEKKLQETVAKVEKRNSHKARIIESLCSMKRKTLIFRFLSNYKNEKRNKIYLKNVVYKIYSEKLRRKGLYLIKKYSFLEKTNAYEQKVKEKTEIDLRNVEESLQKQKENLLSLIYKAEEKLKYENKKKVQTKLELDKIVLKGVSALNMKALMLSQNSLNGKEYILKYY